MFYAPWNLIMQRNRIMEKHLLSVAGSPKPLWICQYAINFSVLYQIAQEKLIARLDFAWSLAAFELGCFEMWNFPVNERR